MDPKFIDQGMTIIKEAVAFDEQEQFKEALARYKQGCNYLITGLKYEKNKRSQEMIRTKVVQYLDRAEQLKNLLQNPAPAKPKAAVPVGGDGKEDEKDADTAKLQAALAGAIVTETPNIHWDDVAGLENAKALLKEAVILPVRFPQLFVGERRPWKGILLYGPPGTGKSFLAKAVATESGASCFLSVSSSDLVSKYQGESERLVKNLFELARAKTPAIIFIDEVDSLVSARGDGENESARRIKTEFLVQMDGVGKESAGVLVLGATNTPWELDPAIRRRFERRVYIPLPDPIARQRLIRLSIGKTPNTMTEAECKALAQQCEGFSGADIAVLTRDALYEPIRLCQDAEFFKKVPDPKGEQPFMWEPCAQRDAGAVEMKLFDVPGDQLKPLEVNAKAFQKAFLNARPSVSAGDLGVFEEWTQEFGQEG